MCAYIQNTFIIMVSIGGTSQNIFYIIIYIRLFGEAINLYSILSRQSTRCVQYCKYIVCSLFQNSRQRAEIAIP